ncbi:MAG: Hsp70 family protein [Labilithrix sp.]|nr:Hsp70 family protein [Labilithrix sp.]MBX3221259.1 Hsp70 family protein [Labilithrix sp.]
MRLGIDFGTTRTVVASADRGNYPVLGFVDDAGDSHDWIPSVVAERDGELLFGFDALAAGARASRSGEVSVVRSFKRLLAETDATFARPVRIGSVEIATGELLTRFLASVRDAVLERSTLSDAARGEGIRSVVAVPANASGAQRLLTLDAFRRAELNPTAILNEPSAAGFEYTHRHRDTLTSRRDHVVVYDLGGGTFDASLVRMRGASHEVLATAGVNRLGGDDFDRIIVDLVLAKAKLAEAEVEPIALARLREQCRDAKERLNPSSRKLSIDLEAALGDAAPQAEIAIAVSEVYEACAPLVEASIEAMLPVMTRLEGSEGMTEDGEAPFARDDIAGIYVVGGASELPIVGRALRARFGRRVHRSPYASGAIAIGLAIAGADAGFELVDRFSRTFGVFREGHDGSEITFDPIFTRDTVLPGAGAGPVAFRRRYRAAHNVGHFRFLECSSMTDDGRPRGHMVFSGDVLFPFEPRLGDRDLSAVRVERTSGESGPRIEEEYVLDEHGLVAVTIKNLDAGFERVFQLGA